MTLIVIIIVLSYYAFKYVCRCWDSLGIFRFPGYELYAGGSCCTFQVTTYEYQYRPGGDNVGANRYISDTGLQEAPIPLWTETSF